MQNQHKLQIQPLINHDSLEVDVNISPKSTAELFSYPCYPSLKPNISFQNIETIHDIKALKTAKVTCLKQHQDIIQVYPSIVMVT